MESRLFSKPKFPNNERIPLLTSTPKEKYSAPPTETKCHFLLEEINECIALLIKYKQKSPHKNPNLYQQYRVNVITSLGIMLLCTGSSGGMTGVMLLFMRIAHERILPELQNQLQKMNELLAEVKPIDEAQTEHVNLMDIITTLFYQWWGGESYSRHHRHAYYDSSFSVPDEVNNCVAWTDAAGNRQQLHELFPKLPSGSIDHESWLDMHCWFDTNNQTHPIDNCRDIATNVCRLSKQDDPVYHYLYSPQNKLSLKEGLWEQINAFKENNLEERVNNPYSEIEPITTTILGITGFMFMVALIYYIYRSYNSHQVHINDLESHGDYASRIGNDHSDDFARIAKLALKLGHPIQDETTTIDFLIRHFEKEADEIKRKSKQRLAFFAGKKQDNNDAGNHAFLHDEASRDILHIIFDYADCAPRYKR